MNKYIRFLKDSSYRFKVLDRRHIFNFLSDKQYLSARYRSIFRRKLDLDAPKTYTEKLQWIKLYDRRPIYTQMVDKYAAKQLVASLVGEEYTVPTLGVWEHFDDILFDQLPDQFVLKCTHDSGSIAICHSQATFDKAKAKRRLEHSLKRDYSIYSREWPYKNVPRRIIAEPYLTDDTFGELRDYKFFTFCGEPKVMYIASGQREEHNMTADFFDMDFKHLDLRIDHDMAEIPPSQPIHFERMKEIAAILSQNIPHVRVDFYEVNGRLYFGELTFFHCGGFRPFIPKEWDKTFGDWITLPPKTI